MPNYTTTGHQPIITWVKYHSYHINLTHCQHCILFSLIQPSIVYSASRPFYLNTLMESQFNCLSWPYLCYQGEVLCSIIISWLCGRPF